VPPDPPDLGAAAICNPVLMYVDERVAVVGADSASLAIIDPSLEDLDLRRQPGTNRRAMVAGA